MIETLIKTAILLVCLLGAVGAPGVGATVTGSAGYLMDSGLEHYNAGRIEQALLNWTNAYQQFLTTKLTAADNVSHVKSALSIRASKSAPGVPIEVDAPPETE